MHILCTKSGFPLSTERNLLFICSSISDTRRQVFFSPELFYQNIAYSPPDEFCSWFVLFWLFLWYLVKLSSSLWLSLSPHWPFTPCSMLRTFCVDIEVVRPLRLYEQLHCFAIDNNWPEPLPARNIFCKNILLLKIFSFSAKHSLRQALFYFQPPPKDELW